MAVKRHLQHVKSNQTVTITVDNNDVTVAKLPAYNDLKDGEIAINYHDGYETISIRNDNNEVVQFPNINYVDAGDTIQTLTSSPANTTIAVGDSHDLAFSKLNKAMLDNELTTARALTDLNDNKQDEIEDLDTIRAGAALGATAIQTETQLSKGVASGNGNAVTDITVNNHQITLTKGATFLTDHQSIKTLKTDNTTAQSTSASETIAGSGTVNLHQIAKTGTYTDLLSRPVLNTNNTTTQATNASETITGTINLHKVAKTGSYNDLLDKPSISSVGTLDTNNTTAQTVPTTPESLSGDIDLHKIAKTGTYTDLLSKPVLNSNNTTAQTASASESITGTINLHKVAKTGTYTDLIGTPDLSVYATSANYDSNTKKIYLKNGSTVLSEIDATDFIKDGMVSNVTIGTIDSSDSDDSELMDERYLIITFNTDAGQEDIEIPLSDIFDPDNYYTKEEIDEHELVTAAALTELHDTKADIEDVYTKEEMDAIIEEDELAISASLNDLHTNKQDNLTFDSTPTNGSSNPVTSGGVYTALNTKQDSLTFDSTPTANSTNPVTSEGIKDYVDNSKVIETLVEPATSTPLAVDDTYDEAFGKLTKIIRDNEEVTSEALTELHDTKADKEDVYGKDEVDALIEDNALVTSAALNDLNDAIEDIEVAIQNIQPELDFDSAPTSGSNNPVTSAGIKTYVDTGDTIQTLTEPSTTTPLAVGDTHDEAFGKLTKIIRENEMLTAGALTQLNNDIEKLTSLTEITYADLVDLRDDGELTPGTWYRITDYETTTTQTNTQSAGNDFDVVVLALSADTLSEEARAIQHDGDTYFANSKLNAWKVWYCLDNDTNRFAWADPVNGKGVIYRLIDEFNNDCPYDFKNIQFKRWAITALTSGSDEMKAALIYDADENPVYFGAKAYDSPVISGATLDDDNYIFAYTFDGALKDAEGNITHYDISANPLRGSQEFVDYMIEQEMGENVADRCDNNHVGNYGEMDIEGDNLAPGLTLPNNVFFNSSYCYYSEDDSEWVYSFSMCYGNTLKTDCYGNTFGNSCFSNTFGNSCLRNTFGNECFSNTFGNSFQNNTFGNSCFSNTFGNDCGNNTFGNYCSSNTFGNECFSNTFGNSCTYNTFGNYCGNNTFGNIFQNNTFGNDCGNNTFGNYCSSNTFGNYCSSNTFGNSFQNNTFGNSCFSNTFGNECYSNTFGNYCGNNTFGNNAEKCSVGEGVNNIRVQKDYVNFIIIENGNQYIDITSTQTTSSSNKLRNFEVALGCNNTTTRKTLSHNTVNDTFKTTYQPASSQTVSV